LQAAKLLQVEKVPVDYQDFTTEADEWAHLVADNRIAELAEIDEKELAVLLTELKAQDVDLDLAGFDLMALEDIGIEEKQIRDAATKQDKADELQERWKVQPGQIWKLGDHLLLCGDALDADNWKQLGGPFKFCFADPPYELAMCVTTLRAATSDHLVFMATDKVLITQPAKCFRSFFVFNYEVPDMAPWTSTPIRQHTLLGWWRFQSEELNLKGMKSVIHVDGTNHDAGISHQEAKPLSLIEPFMKFFTSSGDEVADAFSGSGSALMCAENMDRKSRSVELNPSNCAVILERFYEATGTPPKLTT